MEDHSSTSGWVFLLGGGAISWASKKQTCITSSTMESEFVALAAAGNEAEWLRNLIYEIPLWPKPISTISIRCDSAATLAKAYSQVYNGKSRHLGVRHSMIRELIMNGVISVEFVKTQLNLADHLTKGYQSTLLGSYQTVELIETFMNYQENIRRCVCIIYDPSKSNQGVLALKALKLSDSFMELYRSNEFNGEKLREKNLSWVDIFEEIPIKVSNSALVSAFMTELEADSPVTQSDYDRLQLSTNPFMERNMEFLIECMDDLSVEQQKFQLYYRNLSRQQAQQQTWLQKRRSENMARKAAGEEPLPEEDPSNPIFKPLPEPSRLDSFLITNQVSNYCSQINSVAGQSFSRLFLMKALHEN
ncbi:eukaryotic translation initiation factor 3 subunit H [Tanacetum coccineum]